VIPDKMADLDDFFAKKDKKKKGTKKFSKANTEVIAQKLIETEKKELKEQDKELGTQLSEEKVTTGNSHEDEEWDDYRENKKDYTGLKIETLNIEDKEEEEEEEEETEVNEDGEVVSKKKDESGPWNKAGGNPGEPQQQESMPREQEPSIQMSNVVGGSYVPPHMRGGGAPPPERRERPRGGRNRNAPDITNELYFPSLSSAADDAGPKGAWGKPSGGLTGRSQDYGGGYEEVTSSGGGKATHSRNTEAPRLQLDNKFAALRDGD